MNKRKVMWVVLLILFIIAVFAILGLVKLNEVQTIDNTNTGSNTIISKTTNNTVSLNSISNSIVQDEVNNNTSGSIEYQEIELSDGTLYSIDGKEYKSDIVIGDNYYDTTINDMYLNPESYMDKNIEIEGMYLENLPYTFVGRYSTSNLCAYCPVGYSYIEYQLKGRINKKFTNEEEWIKIIGKLAKGNDASSYHQDYYYLEVLSLEVMNEKGQTTVNN